MTTTKNNEHNKLNVPNSTDKGNVIRNVPHLRFPEFEGEWEDFLINDVCSEFKSGKNIIRVSYLDFIIRTFEINVNGNTASSLAEFLNVVNYIEGRPYIGAVPVELGLTNTGKSSDNIGDMIAGLNTENSEINEGMIRFDIIFYV